LDGGRKEKGSTYCSLREGGTLQGGEEGTSLTPKLTIAVEGKVSHFTLKRRGGTGRGGRGYLVSKKNSKEGGAVKKKVSFLKEGGGHPAEVLGKGGNAKEKPRLACEEEKSLFWSPWEHRKISVAEEAKGVS